MTKTAACAYCETTVGLRVAGCDWNGRPDDFICEDCFTGTDTGPCFDDLPIAMTDPILAKYLAQIDAYSDAQDARLAREAADPRMNALADYIAIFAQPLPRHGSAGFGDIVASLTSARHWRNKRAQSLHLVRKYQLFGHAACAQAWLSKAAEQRKTEKLYRAADRRDEYRSLIEGAADLGQLATIQSQTEEVAA